MAKQKVRTPINLTGLGRMPEFSGRVLTSHGVGLESLLYVPVIDQSGKEIGSAEIHDAYIALAALGEVDAIRDLYRGVGISPLSSGHELAGIASKYGYTNILAKTHLNMQPSIDLERALTVLYNDMATIKEVTGLNPDQPLADLFYSRLMKAGAAAITPKLIRRFVKDFEIKPSPEIAQQIYEGACWTAVSDSTKRVNAWSKLFGIPLKIDGREIDCMPAFAEYAMRKKGEHPSQIPNDATEWLAKYQPERFMAEMEKFSDGLQPSHGGYNKGLIKMLDFYYQAELKGIELTPKIKNMREYYLLTAVLRHPASAYVWQRAEELIKRYQSKEENRLDPVRLREAMREGLDYIELMHLNIKHPNYIAVFKALEKAGNIAYFAEKGGLELEKGRDGPLIERLNNILDLSLRHSFPFTYTNLLDTRYRIRAIMPKQAH